MNFLSINGLAFDNKTLQISVSNSRYLPSLIFSPSQYRVILYYQGPNNIGQQSFSFDPDIFLQAYQDSRYKRSVPKSDYLSFDDIFFSIHYPKANQYVRFIFSCFIINPTIISKLPNRKSHSRLVLSPSRRDILRHLGICLPKSKNAAQAAKNNPAYNEELARISHNLNLAIQKSAASFDLSFFSLYLASYQELRSLNHQNPHLSPNQIDKLLISFSNQVDKLQKNM